jgi:hypothetical protein
MPFTMFHGVQTGSGAHPASSYTMGTGASSPGVMRHEREADRSPPSSAEVKKGGAISPHPHMPSWHSAYLIKHRDNFILPCMLHALEDEDSGGSEQGPVVNL